MKLGCSSRDCKFAHNSGQATNEPCYCMRHFAMHVVGHGWVVPLRLAEEMVARAALVATNKNKEKW